MGSADEQVTTNFARTDNRGEANRAYWLLGNHFTILADESDTDGRYDLIEGRPPAGYQTPPHRHTYYAEQLYVLDGEFTVWIEDRKQVLRRGDSAVIPRGLAHAVAVTGNAPAHGLAIASPSGFARLIREAGTPDSGGPAPEASPEELERFTRIAAELGDINLGPPGALPGE